MLARYALAMLSFFGHSFWDFMLRGGIVMWPLLALSLLGVTLLFERCWFYLTTNHRKRLARVRRISLLLRQGKREQAGQLAADEDSVYGSLVRQLLSEEPVTEAALVEALEMEHHRLERFLPTLSTIITAAPMLGILGTVLGIISSFQILSDRHIAADPRLVSGGIAEALITTAAGLVIAMMVLFPYNALRAQMERTLSRLEALGAAAMEVRSGELRVASDELKIES